MRRTLSRQKLRETPLVHVLAQVRFSHLFDLRDRIPSLKAQLGTIGFPRYQESQIHNIIVEGQTEPVAKVQVSERWDFLDATKTRGVVLTPDFLLLHTNLYDSFEEFAATMAKVLDAVGGTTGAPFVERIGLRYVDLVQPREGETVAEYLKAGLIGYPVSDVPELGIGLSLSRTETRVVTNAGQLAIRCFQRNDGSFLPPDLWPTVLEYPTELRQGAIVTILDLDHSASTAFNFNSPEILRVLVELHDGTDIAFRGAVTPHALTIWGQEIV